MRRTCIFQCATQQTALKCQNFHPGEGWENNPPAELSPIEPIEEDARIELQENGYVQFTYAGAGGKKITCKVQDQGDEPLLNQTAASGGISLRNHPVKPNVGPDGSFLYAVVFEG